MDRSIFALVIIISGLFCSFFYYSWALILWKLDERKHIWEVYKGLHGTILILALIPFAIGMFTWGQLDRSGVNVSWGLLTWHTTLALRILAAIWFAGLVVQVIRYGREFWRQKRRNAAFFCAEQEVLRRVKELSGQLGIRRNIGIKQGYGLVSAELYSAFVPEIHLPEDTYTAEELDGILLHELFHYKNHDLWIRMVLAVLDCIFWFVPSMKRWRRQIERWDELYCDQCVCECGLIEPKQYAVVLHEIANKIVGRLESLKNNQCDRIAFCEARDNKYLCERVECIMKRKQSNKRRGLSLAVLLAIVIGCSGTVSFAAGTAVNQLGYLDRKYLAEGEREDVQPVTDTLVEYTALAEEAPILDGIPSAELLGTSSGNISDVVRNNEYVSKYFKASSGQGITIMISGTPDTVTLQMGIIEPNGYRRWVDVTGVGIHTFKLDQTGYYRVYVSNSTSTSVKIVGTYATVSMD